MPPAVLHGPINAGEAAWYPSVIVNRPADRSQKREIVVFCSSQRNRIDSGEATVKKNPLRVSLLACVLSVVGVSVASAFQDKTAEPTAAQDERAVVRNTYGAAVQDANGQRINYSRRQLEMQEKQAAAKDASSPPPVKEASTATDASWIYATLGSGIGLGNIIVAPNGGTNEIYTTAAYNAYWVALRYNSTRQDYDQIYVSSCFPSNIRRIRVADVIGDSAKEIIVALDDGHLHLYDQATKALITTLTTAAVNAGGMDIADVDGDGANEIVLCTASRLYVYSGAGMLKWDLGGVAGVDLVVGQMDADSAQEIALTDGHIVDCVTHAVQWTWSHGFGVRLAAADTDGDGMMELIVAEGWEFVWGYDVDRQLPKWSISTSQDIGAILLADIDGDGIGDLLVGQGQWGDVIVYDPATQQQKGTVHNPEHGVTNLAVGDVDGDGLKDLLWGAGASSSGQDHLYVASWQTRQIKWQNIHLEGPFIGPEVADLDGDGSNELVVFAPSSDAGYSGGRILVFDAITRRLRAISSPTGGSFSGSGDLRLRDVDGDGRSDILVVGGGSIAIFGFDTSNAFTPKWNYPGQLFSYYVDAADIDNDGQMEIVAGTNGYIYVYNFATGAEEWHSLFMRGAVTALGIADVNQDGTKEVVGMVSNDDVYIFDGTSKLLEDILPGPFTAMRVQHVGGLLSIALGNGSGDLKLYRYSSGDYSQVYSQRLINTTVSGFTIDAQDNVWIGSSTQFGGSGTLTKLTLAGATLASYSGYGPVLGSRVAFVGGSPLFFTTSQYAALGFPGGSALTTIGAYATADQTFYLRNSNSAGFADYSIQYGPPGAIPLVGDWDGNGTATIGVYDPTSQTFYLRNSNTLGFADVTVRYGPPGAIPLAGDWNGDGVTTIGVYDPASQTFYLRNSNSIGFADLTIRYGPPGATPVVGDWDGNGTASIGVYDPTSQTFYLRNSNTIGFADLTIGFGPPGALPIVGDWDGNGAVTIGVFDPSSQTFYLRNSNTIGFADLTIKYGPPGTTPLAGDWNGL